MNKIQWQTRAVKQIRRLPPKNQRQIRDAVDGLADISAAANVKKLTGHKYDYRMRVGSYRVLFNNHTHIEVVSIEEVKKRDERTY